jgi:hypothetical protein
MECLFHQRDNKRDKMKNSLLRWKNILSILFFSSYFDGYIRPAASGWEIRHDE